MLEEKEEAGSELPLPDHHQLPDHFPFPRSSTTRHHSKSKASETLPRSLSNVSKPQALGWFTDSGQVSCRFSLAREL